MARDEEGGVRTQKIIAAIAVLVMIFVAGAVLVEESSNVDASTSYIHGDTNVVAVKGSLTHQIMFFEPEATTISINYTAVLNDSRGNAQPNAVSPSSGSLTNGVESTLTITAPATAGKYTLVVTFKVAIDGAAAENTERTQTISVVNPIVLSAPARNNGNVDFTDFAVYFKLDGKLLEESKTLVSATAGSTTTVTYNLVVDNLSSGRHDYELVAGTENIGGQASFVGGHDTFYVGHSDYGLFNILLFILLIVLLIVVIYLYRKPVKNYGKPKSRR
ncbi:hypothetical protein Mpt1_c13770 [Candidatus Methanoplasma termitum]|uniref:CARDB domain-containing protein n=1 Tax=Candidatus Methanoplasma termitum TaxID=1577791 RepID=A0A0A7LE28_9ARCH|nr:CARDB domain-containing protein [Candidatus Methanoplasma termitum]AIZ57238.1 hypothetical protein Mpt1_c13770 [Candidatus Methanoplasma termitum]MCL2334331.1 hypothetical protein [Candidatus Methanoplasma sp.]